MVEIIMPKMGDGMTEGTIITWLKNVGENVNKGDALLEIETDKATTEIEANGTGVLSQIVVPVGKTVAVGTVIGVIGGKVEVGSVDDKISGADKADENQKTGDMAGATSGGKTGTTSGSDKNGGSLATSGNGVQTGGNGNTSGRVKASPLVRAMVRDKGLDLAQIAGTGTGGRIVHRDLLAYLEQHGDRLSTAPTTALDAAKRIAELEQLNADLSQRQPAVGQLGVSDLTVQDIPTSKMRKAIANRTVQSKQNTPHFYVTMLIEMDRALALLKELNADASEGKVTVNDIIVKACARSLVKVPEVNATWTPENTIRRYAEVHIGVAVGIEDGLIIPVVRDCHKKTLREISVDAKQLITRARNNQLKPEEYSGGTFSVSNLGMMGVDEFIAIINPPEAAILAIGGIARDPVVVGEGDNFKVEARSRMKVTISADHRLLDGVVAARFLQEVKKALEAPFSLLS